MRWLPFQRATLRQDAVAGVVLGVQSVPDGLATGLLAGVSPLSGLYGYMVGTFAGGLTTSIPLAVAAAGACTAAGLLTFPAAQLAGAGPGVVAEGAARDRHRRSGDAARDGQSGATVVRARRVRDLVAVEGAVGDGERGMIAVIDSPAAVCASACV
mgnify:CR=1 FL=1